LVKRLILSFDVSEKLSQFFVKAMVFRPHQETKNGLKLPCVLRKGHVPKPHKRTARFLEWSISHSVVGSQKPRTTVPDKWQTHVYIGFVLS